MQGLGISVVVQLCLVSGLAGLLWPDKMMPIFEVLMFPWIPTQKTLRMHSLGAVGVSVLLFVGLWARPI